jgi:hypothetical protein
MDFGNIKKWIVENPIFALILFFSILYFSKSAPLQGQSVASLIFGGTGIVMFILGILAIILLFVPPFGWMISLTLFGIIIAMFTGGSILVMVGDLFNSINKFFWFALIGLFLIIALPKIMKRR